MPRILTRCLSILLLLGASTAHADDNFPEQPIRLIIPWAAGGVSDLVGRAIAKSVEQTLKQPVIVVNRAGASTSIGMAAVASAKPDGYTLGQMSSSTYVLQAQGRKLPFDVRESFTYISNVGENVMAVVVPADSPYKTLQDLIAAGKEQPGKLSFATAGLGSTPQLLIENLMQATGAKFLHVPYQGSAATMPALVGGFVDFVSDVSSWAPFLRDGRVRLLAISTPNRIADFPGVPTFAELGYQQMRNYNAIVAPAGLPEPIRAKLESAFRQAQKSPEFVAAMKRLSMEIVELSSSEVKKLTMDELAIAERVVKSMESTEALR